MTQLTDASHLDDVGTRAFATIKVNCLFRHFATELYKLNGYSLRCSVSN